MYQTNSNTILDRQTIKWGDLNFVRKSADDKPPSIGTLLTSNILKLKITDLDLLGEYFWGVYTQETLLNASATNTGTFTLTGSVSEQDIDVPLIDNKYAPNNTYYFGMRKVGGEEKIQISFTTGQNLVKATGTDIIDSLPGGSVTYNGLEVNTTNNRILTEGSLELNNITTFDNTKIPTNLAVKTFVEDTISNFDLDTNTDFTNLKTRVSDLETDKRDVSDSYSRTEIDNKDNNILNSANNYTDGEITTLSNSVNTSLAGKEDKANKGIPNGYAGLDGNGLVPSSQLPSFVDDVLEFADLASFPATGQTGKIYVALDTNKTYRWGGSSYIELKDDKAVWGSVEGTLSNQTDLQTALDNKQNNITANSIDFTEIQTIPTNRILGRNTAGTGDVEALTSSEAINTLNIAGAFDNQVRTSRLDQMALPTADLNLNNQKITNLGDPTAGGDAVNKTYTDNQDTITRDTIPFYSLIDNYKTRSVALSQTPTEFQKAQLQQGLSNIKNTPSYYLNGDSAIFDGLNTNFVASGTSNLNGSFDGSSPTLANLTNEVNGIRGFRNVEASSGVGYNNSNFVAGDLTDTFTISFWLYMQGVVVQRLISNNNLLQSGVDILAVGSEIRCRATTNINNYIGRAKAGYLADDNFYKITMVYEKNLDTSADIKIYGNGARIDDIDSVLGTFTGLSSSSTSTLEISSYDSGRNTSPSTITELEILPGIARTESEELGLFNKQKSKYGL